MSVSIKWVVCSTLLMAAGCDERTEARIECPDGLMSVTSADACAPDAECLRVADGWCTGPTPEPSPIVEPDPAPEPNPAVPDPIPEPEAMPEPIPEPIPEPEPMPEPDPVPEPLCPPDRWPVDGPADCPESGPCAQEASGQWCAGLPPPPPEGECPPGLVSVDPERCIDPALCVPDENGVVCTEPANARPECPDGFEEIVDPEDCPEDNDCLGFGNGFNVTWCAKPGWNPCGPGYWLVHDIEHCEPGARCEEIGGGKWCTGPAPE